MTHALGIRVPGRVLGFVCPKGLGSRIEMSTLVAVVMRSELLLLLFASVPMFLGVGIRLVADRLGRAVFEHRGAEPPTGA